MIVEKLEDTLNGGYAGLLGEVVEYDIYRLKKLNFTPSVIIDAGANIGIFTRYAKSLFPDATIISIEPDPENFAHLKKFTTGSNIELINAAIGIGDIYKRSWAENGAHEVYLSYVREGVTQRVMVKTIMPDQLIFDYVRPGTKSVFKLDIEGNENIIWEHESSMNALRQIDYITGEAHWTMLKGNDAYESNKNTIAALRSFENTHYVEIDGVNFWLTKK
jgi:FkbM family methyltransferase